MDDNTKEVLMEFVDVLRGAVLWYFITIIDKSYDQTLINQMLWTLGKDGKKEN